MCLFALSFFVFRVSENAKHKLLYQNWVSALFGVFLLSGFSGLC